MGEDVAINVARLINAAKKGEDDVIEEYLANPSYGVSVDVTDSMGETPLHWASRTGRIIILLFYYYYYYFFFYIFYLLSFYFFYLFTFVSIFFFSFIEIRNKFN